MRVNGRIRGHQVSTTSGPSDDEVEQAAQEIGRLARSTPIHLAWAVGEVVVRRIFGGDLAAVATRGVKDASFRRLASHSALGLGASQLWRAVRVFELIKRVPGLARAKHLGIGHFRAVLGLPVELQERLLAIAEQEEWSTGKIEHQASRLRHPDGPKRGGRPPTPSALRSVRRLARVMEDGSFAEASAGLERLEPEDAEEVFAVIHRLRASLDSIQRVVELSARRVAAE